MVNCTFSCQSIETKKNKSWLYKQYYNGEKSDDNSRNGHGENNWSGAKSLECYSGQFTCDTMHGFGEYRWRHYGEDSVPFTYEGYFYNNTMHGYGVISYPDGRTFRGLFNNNVRWGPGVQSHSAMREDVGLWQGTQLIRLSWKPLAPNITPDFMSNPIGRYIMETHRRILSAKTKIIGESNSAIDLLKECAAHPQCAAEKWCRLYPKYCTDINSPLCYIDDFERTYYKDNTKTILEDVGEIPQYKDVHMISDTYFAWNNNDILINMMKHSYQNDQQRDETQIDLVSILSGSRRSFKSAGKHETDCRALLLTCYLGYIINVAQLINKQNVHPNVCDMHGNTTVMYATCGDQTEIIRFLVEAGAGVDDYNDCCCTPLGVALMRYACAVNDIPPNSMLQALLPPPVLPAIPYEELKILEWNISREWSQNTGPVLNKSPSKTVRNTSSKKIKSLMSLKDQPAIRKKTDASPVRAPESAYDSDDSLSDNKKIYSDANREFLIKINDIFLSPKSEVPYLFEVSDMVTEMGAIEDEPKKAPEKKITSKIIKDTIKTSKVMIGQSNENVGDSSENSFERQRADMLAKMKLTILELLANGAEPKLVRYPQSALVIAISCNSPDLIKHLVQYGADVNEIYPHIHGYSPLAVAVSRQFSWENLETIRALLESGANARRTIYYAIDSSDITVTGPHESAPTLLHAVLVRKIENENEEEIRRHLIDLLLDYNCNPKTQFKGRSAIDAVMSKNIDLFDVFVRNRKTNLNCIINDLNQSILVKMFWNPYFKSIGSTERIQTLTNLLVYGADPLLPCYNGQDKYENIFVFAKQSLSEMENTQQGNQDLKAKKPEKPKKDEKLSTKSMGKMVTDDKEDYKQAIELVTDCARLLHIRWLQGKLVKNLIITVHKYQHRQWNIILNECNNKKTIGLWITPHRGLEIWNILSSSKKKIYNSQRVLKHLLSIITFLAWRFYSPKRNDFTPGIKVTVQVKDLIENDVNYLLKENKTANITQESIPWKCSYVKPELDKADKKFRICFECALPLNENKILCNICKLVYFCSLDCLSENIERVNCHPCSNDIKRKYFREQN